VTASGIVSALAELHSRAKTVLVAIDGPGGAGKSVLAESLRVALGTAEVPACVIAMDDFFLPPGKRPRGSASEKPIGGDFDWRRLRAQVLDPLRSGRSAQYDQYDWVKDGLSSAVKVDPGRVVIIEGVYSSRRELAALYDLRVWVECPRELRLSRGLERDGETARQRWEEDWMASEDRYIQEHRPHESADVIVAGYAV
jgi:uridine kinase